MVLTSVRHAVANTGSCRRVVSKQLLKGTESMNSKLKTAVGYIRMSTDQQQDSPERQRRDIEAMAVQSNYKIIKWYEDHGQTGTESSKRKEFKSCLWMRKPGRLLPYSCPSRVGCRAKINLIACSIGVCSATLAWQLLLESVATWSFSQRYAGPACSRRLLPPYTIILTVIA